MSTFTSEEAFEFQGTEDAVMLDWPAVRKIIKAHGLVFIDFCFDTWPKEPTPDLIDAGDLFAWLGY